MINAVRSTALVCFSMSTAGSAGCLFLLCREFLCVLGLRNSWEALAPFLSPLLMCTWPMESLSAHATIMVPIDDELLITMVRICFWGTLRSLRSAVGIEQAIVVVARTDPRVSSGPVASKQGGPRPTRSSHIMPRSQT